MNWLQVADALADLPAPPAEILALDLARVAELGDPIVATGVRVLRRGMGARTVGDVVFDHTAAELLQHGLPRDERRAFLRAFVDAVRKTAAEELIAEVVADTPAAEQAHDGFDIARPPSGGRALDAWAKHFGVSDAFDISFHHAERGRRGGRRLPAASLREWLDLERYPDFGVAYGYPRTALRRAAVEEIVERARRVAPLLDARKTFLARQREPSDTWLANRVLAYRAKLAATDYERQAGFAAERTYPSATVTFMQTPPAISVQFDRRGAYLVDIESGQIRDAWYANALIEPKSLEHRAALACAADALCDPDASLAGEIIAWRAVPAWRHALVAFEQRIADNGARRLDAPLGAAAGDQIAFRVDEHGKAPAIILQKAKKTGGYSAGRQLDPYHALRLPDASPLEREIIEIAHHVERATYADESCKQLRIRALELLGEHPRVQAGEEKASVRVRHARPTLRVASVERAEARSFVLELAIGSVAWSPQDALARITGDILRYHDDAAGTFWFAPLDETTLALLDALAEHPVALTDEGLDAFLARLTASRDLTVDLDLPDDVRGRAVAGEARTVVRLALGDSLSVSLRVKPLASAMSQAAAFLPGELPRHVYGSDEAGRRVFATRDLDEEESRAEHLLSQLPIAGALRKGAFDLFIDSADRMCDLVATLRELGESVIVEWADERIRVAGSASTRSLRLKIERRKDWFGLDGGVEIDGEHVPLFALLDAVRAGRRFVRLDGGRLVLIERDLRARLSRVDDAVERSRGAELVVHPPALSTVSALVDDEEQIVAAKEWNELHERILRAREHEPSPPAGLRAELRAYQLDGYKWLMRLAEWGAGACLADDMGLGKTLQSLAVLCMRKHAGPALVVAPTSVCRNWIVEAARFAPDLDVFEYRGARRTERLEWLGPGHVLVTSYDILARDASELRAIEFATAIFDEAQAIKNALSKRAAATREVRAAFRMALTGTPVENHTGDLWSIFRTIVPGLFGPWEKFRQRFTLPIERDKDTARREALAAMVRPYLLRRTKREVAPELPPRTEVVRLVEPSSEERELYEAERVEILASMKGGSKRKDEERDRFAILAALTRLRQLACHPRLRHADAPAASAKLEAVLALVDELREAGHKALVFSQFTSHLAIVAEALRARGVTFFELDGSTPADARAERVERFQSGEADLFLISLKAGGVGLNLTAADYVLHLDPWWNPAAEDQASDRAHRIGQDKPVTIVRFVSRGTIEETVLELHAEKRELADAILSGGDVAGRLGTRELFALIEATDAD